MTVQKTAENAEDANTESVDTSTNDEAQETDTELEEMEENFESEVDSESSESEETDESGESEEEDSEQSEESTDDGQEESTEDADEESNQEEDPANKKPDPAKAKEAFAKREAARIAKDQAKKEAEQKYLDEAEDTRDLALRQLQVDAYNNRILTNNNTLQNAADKALAHIDLFKNESPEVKEAIGNALDDFEAMYVSRDKNGDPTEVRGDLFEFLQKRAESIRKLMGVGERNQQKAKSNTKARTLSPPNRAPKKPKTDPDLEGFDEEADRW